MEKEMCEHPVSKYWEKMFCVSAWEARLGADRGAQKLTQPQHPSFSLDLLLAARVFCRVFGSEMGSTSCHLSGQGRRGCILGEVMHMGRRPLLSTGAMGSQSRNFAPVPGGSEKPRREPGQQTATAFASA